MQSEKFCIKWVGAWVRDPPSFTNANGFQRRDSQWDTANRGGEGSRMSPQTDLGSTRSEQTLGGGQTKAKWLTRLSWSPPYPPKAGKTGNTRPPGLGSGQGTTTSKPAPSLWKPPIADALIHATSVSPTAPICDRNHAAFQELEIRYEKQLNSHIELAGSTEEDVRKPCLFPNASLLMYTSLKSARLNVYMNPLFNVYREINFSFNSFVYLLNILKKCIMKVYQSPYILFHAMPVPVFLHKFSKRSFCGLMYFMHSNYAYFYHWQIIFLLMCQK